MNDDNLRALTLQYCGSVLEALVQLAPAVWPTRRTLGTAADLANTLGMSRQALEEATGAYDRGRTFAHHRRSIESQMGLSQYLLDELLPEDADGK